MQKNNSEFGDFFPLIQWAEKYPLQFIKGENGLKIAYRHFKQGSKKLVVLVNGRVENLLKWSFVAKQFFDQGYDVVALDHRGQGYSDRILGNLHKGYVENFKFYTSDLNKVIQQFNHQYSRCFLVAHSMGSLISSHYLAKFSHSFSKAVLCAPFWGIPTNNLKRDKILVKILMALGQKKRYLPHHGDYQPINPQKTLLTHNLSLINWFNQIIEQCPNLALGGGTVGWLNQCWQAIDGLSQILPKINIPTMVLQAQNDDIVNNHRTPQLVQLLPKVTYRLVENAYHEILFEKPEIYQPIMAEIFEFLEK